MTLNKRLAANIRRLRAAQDLTQQALAEKAGSEYKYLQKIEAGQPLNITFETLEKLAKALKVDAADLLKRA